MWVWGGDKVKKLSGASGGELVPSNRPRPSASRLNACASPGLSTSRVDIRRATARRPGWTSKATCVDSSASSVGEPVDAERVNLIFARVCTAETLASG